MTVCAFVIGCLFQDGGELQDALSKVSQATRAKVSPSVVAILVERSRDPEGVGPRGARADIAEFQNRPKGPCTGTIVSADGLIATSAFNISGEIKSISVTVAGFEKPFEGKLLGFDKEKDIALLKIEAPRELPVLERGDLAAVKVGNFAFLVGRAPDPASATINFGIVSALHRFGGGHLQYDAELNYGNVGGPLVDLRGRLIGIATHIRPRTPWGQSGGVGFALKMTEFEKLLPQLKTGGKKERTVQRRASLGIVMAAGPKNMKGVMVSDLMPDSPAAKAGLKVGDVITEVESTTIEKAEDLNKALERRRPGDSVRVKALRANDDGEYREFQATVTLSEEEEY
ncbi:MAG TPA: trypsin-like peptidase domain-containing protein [Planctomycetota bacterium]|nr:trypsin-like peptidase domain-containing protein [Planctomycetota bacterium]